jgi:AraC-like DNA-binding protein
LDPQIQNALDIIHQRYAEPISVGQIAGYVGLERCYFSCKFKEYTQQSPYQYLNRLRIHKACILFEHTLCTVNEAAEAVGIPPENFARVFRKWTGTTPGAYCASVRKEGSPEK